MSRTKWPAASCRDCDAWGGMAHRGLCKPCYDFAAHNRDSGPCGACRRVRPLKKDHCRSCWVQARLDRPPLEVPRHRVLLPYVRQVRYHQLFLAGTPAPRDAVVKRPRRYGVGTGAPGLLAKAPPPPATRPTPQWVQPPLPDTLPRYQHGRFDLRSDPVPDNPWLAWALHIAHSMAETHGWSGVVTRKVNRTLLALLADHTGAEPLRASVIWPVLSKRNAGQKHTQQVLNAMGILTDDRPTTFEAWLAGKLGRLTPRFAEHVAGWARSLHDGAARSHPRADSTARNYLAAALPALEEWSARRGHLREITRDDVLDQIQALTGRHRQSTLTALRSLFAWAKRNKVIFRDPAAQVKIGQLERGIFQPLAPDDINRTIAAATSPHARLYVALAAVHAARHGQIRTLQLGDVDIANRRLTIAGRTRPLDDLTHRLLTEWLDHRRKHWPNTTNPHLLISAISANGTDPVSHPWLNRTLRGLPASLERLRIDRQLEEALTHGPDPLHLSVIFGLDTTTAIRYAASARQLLQRPHEDHPSSSPRTEGSTGAKPVPRPSGSC